MAHLSMLRKDVLLHGYAGSQAAWDGVRAALPSGKRVLCPALVGHAPDTGPASDFESEIARLARLIAAAGPGKPTCAATRSADGSPSAC